MTKAELIEEVQKTNKDAGLSKATVGFIVDSVFDVVAKTIKIDKRFSYPDFGTFSVKDRKERKGRNPRTGDTIMIKASKTVTFKPSPKLKSSI